MLNLVQRFGKNSKIETDICDIASQIKRADKIVKALGVKSFILLKTPWGKG